MLLSLSLRSLSGIILRLRTYVRPRCNNTRRVHGVAWSGVEWRGDTVVCEVAHAYACSQHLLLQDGRSRHYVGDVTIHMCRPRGTRVPVLSLSLPPRLSSCTTRELIPDFSHFVLFCYFVVSTSVDKRWSNWDIVSFFFSLRWKDKG